MIDFIIDDVVLVPWLPITVVLYFVMKYYGPRKVVLPEHFTARFILLAIFCFLPEMIAVRALVDMHGIDMSSYSSCEQSCGEVVRKMAMITSISMAIGATSAIFWLIIPILTSHSISILRVVALALLGGFIAGIGGYGIGTVVGTYGSIIAIGITTVLVSLSLYFLIQRSYPERLAIIGNTLMVGVLMFITAYGVRVLLEAQLAGTLPLMF